ncbi:hypothetical protein MBLNU230_g6274t1 [Neophaeotheca triangularis]
MAATKSKLGKETPLPTIGRQGPSGSAKKPAGSAKGKEKGKPNSSILSFFKKSESEADGSSLFVADSGRASRERQSSQGDRNGEDEPEMNNVHTQGETRFNEAGGSNKRRRISAGSLDEADGQAASQSNAETPSKPDLISRQSGPFLDDSESEPEQDSYDEEREDPDVIAVKQESTVSLPEGEAFTLPTHPENAEMATTKPIAPQSRSGSPQRPPLIKDETSYGPGIDEFKDFEGIEDFDEDLFEGGDEFMERRYMEEQARMEGEDDEDDYDNVPAEGLDQPHPGPADTGTEGTTCPLCSVSLSGIGEQDAAIHVNNCLDGNPTPLPKADNSTAVSGTDRREVKQEQLKQESPGPATKFKRPVRPPKPGQENPFTLSQPNSTNGGSAFSQLMSGHAEDAAWASAAASEHAARGKPAYQRMCPFYKILPGLFICVDAFRYGAVAGCQAYFLSHFHSDHYVGLTSTWCHGPIYCSRVTANLVRQQLRVDPKWVIGLDFEETVEVPGTKGVKVTMISANHCPGSSLYLFEKIVGKKSNGEPRLQRVLHCGDFRACKAHIQHPLLIPDVQDSITGKQREQKIDVCYLDTTYLNPKYAFPSQEAVITACSDMCVSLNKVAPDESDGWEQMKRQRAGEGMAKFVRKESNPEIQEEVEPNVDPDGMKIERAPKASQQILSSTNTKNSRGRLLVVVGTYSIGKERICLGIAKALKSKIYAPAAKQRICAALEDPELNALLTRDPREAQVHMTPLFEIRAETLDDYLKDYFPHFTRAVGFRPSGWNYRPPTSRFTDSPTVQTVLYSDNWRSNYSMKDLVPQRGSTSRASCFGVPYSEHSSFRELTMFCCALRIEKIIPTVNVGNAKTREKMKAWCERWAVERKKNGVFNIGEDGVF